MAAPVMARGNGGRPRLELEREAAGPTRVDATRENVGVALSEGAREKVRENAAAASPGL